MVCDADVAVAVFSSTSFVREGLASFLRGSHFRVISTAALSGGVITPADDGISPLLILAAPEGASEFEAVHSLNTACSEAKLVIFGHAAAPESLPRSLCLAAHAVLDSGISREALLSVLDVVMLGGTVQFAGLLPQLAAQPEASGHAPADQRPLLVIADPGEESGTGAPVCHGLSPRELKVLRCLAEGASNKAIARHYDLAEATVKIHVKNILRKLNAQNRTQAAIWAREQSIHLAQEAA
jgi:two-component system, NarL family, nitrate/nitrite response regulator NarL